MRGGKFTSQYVPVYLYHHEVRVKKKRFTRRSLLASAAVLAVELSFVRELTPYEYENDLQGTSLTSTCRAKGS